MGLPACQPPEAERPLPGSPGRPRTAGSPKPQPRILPCSQDSNKTGGTLGKVVLPKVRAFLDERLKFEKENLPQFSIPNEKADTKVAVLLHP